MSETTTTPGRPAACFTFTKSQDRPYEFTLSINNRVSASLSLSRTETAVVFHLDGVRFDAPVNQMRWFALTLFDLLDMPAEPAEDTDERGAAV